jgi:CRP-like cAMP-binding protein
MSKENRLLQMLPAGDRAALAQHLRPMQLKAGDVLAEPGDDIRSVYFPHAGIISFMVELEDGSFVQTVMVGRDGVVGAAQALDNKRSINKIVVQIPGLASVIDRNPLRDLAERHSAIRDVLAAHEQFLIADIQQTAACNARHPMEARVARWILRMRDLAGDDFPLTQDYLAAMIGVRRSGVSEIARRLQAAGTIQYSRGRLQITEPAQLERSSCECHRAVEQNYKSVFGVSWP